jgi:hypothetical protein
VALAANGGVASASSTYSSNYPVAALNNGDRKGVNWGAGGGWNDATSNVYPDWVQIDFSASQTINEIDLFTLPGVTDFQVQYWTGTTWADVPGGYVTGNRNVWRQMSILNVTTSKIRVLVNASLNGYSRIVELEAYSSTTPTPTPAPITRIYNLAWDASPSPSVIDYRLQWGLANGGNPVVLSNLVDVGPATAGSVTVPWPNDGAAHSVFVVAVAFDGAQESLPSNALEIDFAP